jgi:hypothetical protein
MKQKIDANESVMNFLGTVFQGTPTAGTVLCRAWLQGGGLLLFQVILETPK